MSTVVLTCQSEKESAERLGFKTFTSTEDVPKRALVIRWGHSGGPAFKFEVNKASAIKLNVDKFASKQIIAGAVRAPKLFGPGSVLPCPAIVRPTNHQGGESFRVRQSGFAIPAGHYGSQALSPSKEYRVWFDGDRMTMVGRRTPMNAEQDAQSRETYPCRSQWGYEWIESPDQTLRDYAKKAADAIDLDFGAADFLLHEGKYYCLELNSAPSLDHSRVLLFFKRYFADME